MSGQLQLNSTQHVDTSTVRILMHGQALSYSHRGLAHNMAHNLVFPSYTNSNA
jgi:hypothetical protein